MVRHHRVPIGRASKDLSGSEFQCQGHVHLTVISSPKRDGEMGVCFADLSYE